MMTGIIGKDAHALDLPFRPKVPGDGWDHARMQGCSLCRLGGGSNRGCRSTWHAVREDPARHSIELRVMAINDMVGTPARPAHPAANV